MIKLLPVIVFLLALFTFAGCDTKFYDPTIPEVLTGQGVDKDGGICYFKIGIEVQTKCFGHYRSWGYRVKVENLGDDYLQEEYKTIEEVFVDKMPGARRCK